MIPSTFSYVQAQSVREAIQLLQESNGEGKLLAGGHSLVPLLKFRLTTPGTLIDIGSVEELRGVRKEENRIVVGALTSYKQILRDPTVSEHLPVLAEAVRQIGDIQIRNRGTIGGNLAHADPAADIPGVALALEALLEIQGEDGAELVEADGFFLGPLVTALPETSILTSVSFLIPPDGAKSTYLKYAHPASGYAVVGVCAIAATDPDGLISYIRIGINGAGDIAYRARSVEDKLLGHSPTPDRIREAAAMAAEEGEMGSDHFASAEYRKHLCTVYTERALRSILL
ncbi:MULTISPECIES: xanthine dehydrogenase family protein subunit M [Brevibacillus]|uniref:FAD binding domain-containing protein n=1 Tax=Brevibacillus TaxID=55080 RepID=UPI00203F6AB5|nr:MULTISPECIES: xanthine dehydrogenase family protein subunit M [Brevibacillus]MCM3081587.1 xanthine dehydrogenase family protein subunit M [Brevibacillus invocatus]MCM3431962.1 xanthine dehydrogenase family protein subunit M [Brevibacillus invocatus]MDH4617929.1 xanthine dehydrogenase family protein subunit M [Brevibacillus sp. AY1]